MYVFSRDSYASTGLELDENRETPGARIADFRDSKADTSDSAVLYDPTSVPKTTKCISG